jgi:hypothetical protein
MHASSMVIVALVCVATTTSVYPNVPMETAQRMAPALTQVMG